jgi:hypothetical protein
VKYFNFRNIFMILGVFFSLMWMFLPKGSLKFATNQIFKGRTKCGNSAKLGAQTVLEELNKVLLECDSDDELQFNVAITKSDEA